MIDRSEPKHGLALIERLNDEDHTYRISYGELFAPIVKALQQQQVEMRQQNADLRRAGGADGGFQGQERRAASLY